MATVTITVAAGANAGEKFRRLARQIEKAASVIPDNLSSGASTVLTIDNGTGTATVQVTSGPITSSLFLI